MKTLLFVAILAIIGIIVALRNYMTSPAPQLNQSFDQIKLDLASQQRLVKNIKELTPQNQLVFDIEANKLKKQKVLLDIEVQKLQKQIASQKSFNSTYYKSVAINRYQDKLKNIEEYKNDWIDELIETLPDK